MNGQSQKGSSHVSLWGQKANLMGQPCYWQLSGRCSVPDLEALTVCVTLQREVGTSEWTAFDYKERGHRGVELGLTGTRTQLRVWLFGQEHQVNMTENYPLHQWHTVCLTWSAKSGHLRLYGNGSRVAEVPVNGPRLAGKGTLTLGVSHTMLDGVMAYETGKELMGFATLFRMWGREFSETELKELRCVDGDVVSWNQLHWDLKGTYCQPPSDSGLTCGEKYIKFACLVYVEVTPIADVLVVHNEIRERLRSKFYHDGVEVKADQASIMVFSIDPGFCPDNLQQTLYGLYEWPRTEPQDRAVLLCEKNSRERTTRFCKLDGKTDKAKWERPDLSLCERTIDINDLENVTVTANNSGEIVDMIGGLVGNGSELSDSQLDTVLDKLGEVVNVGPVSPGVAENIVEIISDVLQSKADLASFTNEILGLTDSVGDTMNFTGEAHGMTAPSLALQLVSVNASRFLGLTFGVSSFTSNNSPEIFMNETFVERPHGAVAAISLPSVLESFFPRNNTNNTRTRIQFQFYNSTVLFKNPSDTMQLNSYVVSASMTDANVSNLQQPIIITLRHLNSVKGKDQSVQCVYWDFTKNGGGGWESRGCKVKSECSDAFQTTCHCDHLTHFGVLLDISKEEISAEDEVILTIISYLGCGLSSIFLGITLLTYIAFEKLRQDYPSKILINLSLALLGLNLVFLVNSWFSSLGNRGVCVGVAAAQHFFVLASFTWMGLEALHMYFALVKVFNTYVPSYILKFCLLGWGIPAAIVTLVLAIDTNIYGSAVDDDPSKDPLKDSSPFCWVQDETAFYVSVMAFILLVLLCNIAVFGVVLVQIRKMQANKASSNSSGLMHDLRVVASLTFLLGLTWILPFFGWGPLHTPFMYLFSILNSLQGFFIFIFHCLMKENVQKQWRLHLCCGSLRPGDYSEWSRSMTGAGRGGHSRLVNFPSIKTEDTSSMRKISDSSASGASQINA
ncbi:adhesion G-protein coupled receptor G4 [Engraulis encrasicolus]|uniref:adhesion G-protein coupled receptor G4 n=1 Tax=Engraulis encrasicolus TaxID=184585 RepID=UPI002FD499A6